MNVSHWIGVGASAVVIGVLAGAATFQTMQQQNYSSFENNDVSRVHLSGSSERYGKNEHCKARHRDDVKKKAVEYVRAKNSGVSESVGTNRSDCYADGCLADESLQYPAGELGSDVKDALLSALDDEYKAHATYTSVLRKFGSVRPFVMIARSEEMHIASLKALFDKYGMQIPDNPYEGKVNIPQTLSQACQIGVDAEISNAALYRDRLLPVSEKFPDVTKVFTNLMNASQERHLQAFERCASS